MSGALSLTIANNTGDLDRLRLAVEAFAESHALPIDLTHGLQLVIDEVVANIIRHAHDDQDEHPIDVDVEVGNGVLRVEIVDDGKEFNPLIAPPPRLDVPLEERRPGGLGIHIVKSIMDELEYRRADGRNTLVMVKHLAAFDAGTLA